MRNVSAWPADFQNLVEEYQGPDAIPEFGSTTLMIRNMPRSYTVEAVMCEIDSLHPKCHYDFVNLPWDTRRGSNISYVFCNFVDPDSAMRAFFALSGRSWTLVRTQKVCRVATAHVQGLAENLANYVASSGIQENNPYGPVIFQNGRRLGLAEAARIFCTAEIMQRTKESLSISKMQLENPLPGTPGDLMRATSGHFGMGEAQSPVMQEEMTEAESALEFSSSFREFCRITAEGVPPCALTLDEQQDPKLEFWLRFRTLCARFFAEPATLPELFVEQAPDGCDAEHVSQNFALQFQSLYSEQHVEPSQWPSHLEPRHQPAALADGLPMALAELASSQGIRAEPPSGMDRSILGFAAYGPGRGNRVTANCDDSRFAGLCERFAEPSSESHSAGETRQLLARVSTRFAENSTIARSIALARGQEPPLPQMVPRSTLGGDQSQRHPLHGLRDAF